MDSPLEISGAHISSSGALIRQHLSNMWCLGYSQALYQENTWATSRVPWGFTIFFLGDKTVIKPHVLHNKSLMKYRTLKSS